MSTIDDARDMMAESLIDLIDFKVTVPLSEKTKNIHTNTFIYFEPLPYMEDMESLYSAMGKTKSTRYVAYRKGYWYVKGVRITYADSKQEMELTLSPFPSVFNAQKLDSKTTTSTANATQNSNSNNKSSSKKKKSIEAPSWLSKSDREWAEKTVKKAIGTKKKELQKAKAIYNYFKDRYGYEGYRNLKYTTPKGNREKGFKKGRGNCADGANILCTLMRTAGINARIKHAPNHYIVKLKIDGKVYWVDNHGTKSWNKIYGKSSESESNITKGAYING